jgi:hypothetical protein
MTPMSDDNAFTALYIVGEFELARMGDSSLVRCYVEAWQQDANMQLSFCFACDGELGHPGAYAVAVPFHDDPERWMVWGVCGDCAERGDLATRCITWARSEEGGDPVVASAGSAQ